MDQSALDLRDTVVKGFASHLGGHPDVVVRAPGRVNLIGEHTDYNGGFVLPMAIDRGVWIALRYRTDSKVKVCSLDFESWGKFDLKGFSHRNSHWCEYIKGVAKSLQGAGCDLCGWEGVLIGNVPRGSGLSSSAALELAAARAFAEVSSLEWNPVKMALAGQRAENDWVGVNCGIMDQMISACGKAGHAFLLDCQSMKGRFVPVPEDLRIVVLDTSTRRGLVGSAYNERRACCEQAAKHFGKKLLRDVSAEEFAAREQELSALDRKRARHVITEDQRTLAAVQAMCGGRNEELGRLMVESHMSLRDDFEVTNDALNAMVDCALEAEGCLGARMTGAGFGGCAVALVERAAVAAFAEQVSDAYRKRMKLEPAVYLCRAVDGAGRA